MKRLVAVMSMTVAISLAMWSQKPQTCFCDLKHRRAAQSRSQIVMPPVQRDLQGHTNSNDNGGLGKLRNYYDDVWSRTSFINLGYALDQSLKIGGTNYGYNAKWGGALQVGNSYLLPKKAFFGMVKVGVDATWFDLSGAQYDDPVNDRYHLSAGMGIGASLHVAPFAYMGEALRPLRIEAYCRFVPSYSVLLRQSKAKYEDENGNLRSDDMKAHGAFLPVVSYGLAIDYKCIGIGYEQRSGNADYKDLTEDRGKIKYDMTSSRIYISFRM